VLKTIPILAFAIIAVISAQSFAGGEAFTRGPVFAKYGENATVENGIENAAEQHFKVAFDIFEEVQGDGVNRSFNSVARFINMHVRAGVALANIEVAIVVHGKASPQLLNPEAYEKRFSKANVNQDLLEQLMAAGVTIALCGQSAAFADVDSKDLLPGVKMSLSAMTAHALLQQQGYTLNPF